MAQELTQRNLPSETSAQGLVQVFTGDGKGKTTAALGTVLRALGQGRRVFIVFFMKGEYPYGERAMLAKLDNVDVESYGSLDFVNPRHVKPKDREQAELALGAARRAMLSGKYDLIVLDESIVAVAFKLLPLSEVIKLIDDKPPAVELIFTGQLAPPELIERADLVTRCEKIKHPYDKGVGARCGVDY